MCSTITHFFVLATMEYIQTNGIPTITRSDVVASLSHEDLAGLPGILSVNPVKVRNKKRKTESLILPENFNPTTLYVTDDENRGIESCVTSPEKAALVAKYHRRHQAYKRLHKKATSPVSLASKKRSPAYIHVSYMERFLLFLEEKAKNKTGPYDLHQAVTKAMKKFYDSEYAIATSAIAAGRTLGFGKFHDKTWLELWNDPNITVGGIKAEGPEYLSWLAKQKDSMNDCQVYLDVLHHLYPKNNLIDDVSDATVEPTAPPSETIKEVSS